MARRNQRNTQVSDGTRNTSKRHSSCQSRFATPYETQRSRLIAVILLVKSPDLTPLVRSDRRRWSFFESWKQSFSRPAQPLHREGLQACFIHIQWAETWNFHKHVCISSSLAERQIITLVGEQENSRQKGKRLGSELTSTPLRRDTSGAGP